MSVDPHFRFFLRLTLGRGSSRTVMIALLTAGVALAAVAAHLAAPGVSPRQHGWPGDRGLLFVAFVLATFGSCLPAARILDLEAAGFMDHIRMTGSSSAALLARLIAGTALPYVAPAALLVVVDVIVFRAPPGAVAVAACVCVVALDAGLWIVIERMRSVPALTPAEGTAIKGFFVWMTTFVTMPFFTSGWARGDSASRIEIVFFAFALAILPILLWRTARRLDRPIAARQRWQFRLGAYRLARAIPRSGPPEFVRQLRSTIALSGGFGIALWAQLGLLGVVFVTRRFNVPATETQNILIAVTILMVAVSGLMVLSMVKQEIQKRTIELVWLTPQRSDTIALGWYAGMALPCWTTGMLTAASAIAISPDIASRAGFWQALIGVGLVAPAIGLADGLAARMTDTMTATAFFTLMVTVLGVTFFVIPAKLPGAFPFGLEPRVVVPAAIAAAALGVAIGRLRQGDGPPLAGGAAAGAIVAILLALRLAPPWIFPRLAVCVLVLAAPLFSADRREPGAPWLRLVAGAVAAGVVVAIIGRTLGLDATALTASALAAAAGFATGVLMYEALPVKPLALPIALAFAFVLYRPTLDAALVPFRDLVPRPSTPSALSALDLAFVAMAFVAAAGAHAATRRRNARVASLP